eukprot:37554-Amphidinium_carterae.1
MKHDEQDQVFHVSQGAMPGERVLYSVGPTYVDLRGLGTMNLVRRTSCTLGMAFLKYLNSHLAPKSDCGWRTTTGGSMKQNKTFDSCIRPAPMPRLPTI